jgi:hypothetical protein
MPLEGCRMFAPVELSTRVLCGEDVLDDRYWQPSHLRAFIKPAHGYTSTSAPFVNLLEVMAELDASDRKSFLSFVTGAPALPLNGFAALK